MVQIPDHDGRCCDSTIPARYRRIARSVAPLLLSLARKLHFDITRFTWQLGAWKMHSIPCTCFDRIAASTQFRTHVLWQMFKIRVLASTRTRHASHICITDRRNRWLTAVGLSAGFDRRRCLSDLETVRSHVLNECVAGR